MKYLPVVVRATYRGDFRIHITFSDQSENTIDFRPWLNGPMFEPLKAPNYFERFFVDGGTVVWPNGADIAPEALYDVDGRQAHSNVCRPSRSAHRAASTRKGSRLRLRG